MGTPHRTSRLPLLALTAALVASGVLAVPAQADAPYETVVDQLRNPRGLDFSADGKLYVAEGGNGGDVCFEGIDTEEGEPLCAGFTARISRVNTKANTRSDYITGLVSLGGPLFAIGASGMAVKGNQVFGLMAANAQGVPPADMCGGGPECQQLVAAATTQLGHLLRGTPSGGWAWKQDVGGFNYDWTVANKDTIGAGVDGYQPGWADNPDFEPGDANPYALAAAPGGTYMVDGGSNTLTFTPQVGQPRVVAAFPNPPAGPETPYDSVPTCVAPTAQGVVVADLSGHVFRVDGSSLTVAPSDVTSADGAFLGTVGGCDSDGHGNVYISDIFLGSVVKLNLASMTLSWVRPPGTLNFPSAVAVGSGGWLYVANNSVCPSFPTGGPCDGVTGSVVRMRA